ncbi:PREDICTED: sorting nexin-19 isoform X1 [Crocodylus porosus]|uniref:Sorting nexin-19 n=1 Tax=Crocodylus porosus TaxID=8502 RepID=A0A7M4DZI3_CROPO|nr:PREDICTED: sorting nexin-19 isoform X1 [Crocodylus porosus]
MKSQRMLKAQGAGSLGDLIGTRKLIALGAVLGWLLIVHLLVNVWLLCILSGLLAVLGGWLGSQAVVSTSKRIHLERFVVLEPCPQSPEAERQLDAEIDLTIQKIIRDFVSSWYQTVSSERSFEEELRKAMAGVARELKRRMALVDRQALTQKVLLLCGCHLQSYMKARETVGVAGKPGDPQQWAAELWRAYSASTPPHPAVQSPAMEVNYTRGVVDLLLQGLVPKPHLETRTGRFVVVELITCNVLLPMIHKVADPDWINLLLIGIFSKTGSKVVKAGKGEEAPPPSPSCQASVPSSLLLKEQLEATPEVADPSPRTSEPPRYDEVDGVECNHQEREDGRDSMGGESSLDMDRRKAGSMPVRSLQPDTLGSLFPCEDLELESPMSDLGKDSDSVVLLSTEDFLPGAFQDSFAELEGPDGLDQEDAAGGKNGYLEDSTVPSSKTCPLTTMLGPCPDIQIDPVVEKEESLAALTALLSDPEKPFSQRPSFLGKELVSSESQAQSPLDPSQPPTLLSSSPTAPLNTFSFEPLSSPDGPVVIQNLRITGTITAREHSGTGFHPYTLYTVKYETALESENASSLQQVAYHTVNRRYREFLNLQTRLEEKPDLRKFLKNIKGPKKLFPDLPFGNMDSDRVEARKSLLESFLKQLCAIPEITNSEEVQEFLALNTDARIAFVKKPFVVSRIDKIMVNAIVDTLKTAFPKSEPQSPTEDLSEAEVDGKSQPDGKKSNKPRLRFPSSKIAPVLSVPEVNERVLYALREGSAVSDTLSVAGMESFIQKQEKLLETMPSKAPENEGDRETKEPTVHNASTCTPQPLEHQDDDDNPGSETVLADIALDLLRLLMMDHWSWLCTENMQKVLHLLFSTLIQRWLEVQVANLTCTQHWVQYLRVLQESIWPGGILPVVPKPARTQEQKKAAAEQALQSLMEILPDIILEILGTSKCQLSWNLVLESLHQPIMNRHLVFSFLDILLEILNLDNSSDEPKTTAVAPSVSSPLERGGISPR